MNILKKNFHTFSVFQNIFRSTQKNEKLFCNSFLIFKRSSTLAYGFFFPTNGLYSEQEQLYGSK